MKKLLFLAFLVGIGIAHCGYQEYVIGHNASKEPIEIELSSIEDGIRPESNYIEIGEHWAVFTDFIFSYQYIKGDEKSKQLTDDTSISSCFYPIKSSKYNDFFTILVKTYEYSKLGQVPESDQRFDHISGMLTTQIYKLNDEEYALLNEVYPEDVLANILILSENTVPTSVSMSIFSMLTGLLICAGSVWLFIQKKK